MQPTADGPSAQIQLLLVDDHTDSLNALARLFQLDGYSVRQAGTVAEAFRLALAAPPDVLVSDLELTDGDGCQLLRRLRELYPYVRGIALTGYDVEEYEDQCRDAGFEAVLTKPADFEQIAAAIEAGRFLPHAATAGNRYS